ncbi:hypothetical protein HF521_013017 [Silurus meridionalis]|uniref:Transmembrane protein 255B n=1 Tax=Silurus meridionalis TaxID=175797 RepID=A0A8T0AC15_SILME|nr:hypothetical protein HF521_013017 [Silurus meridionalis]
MQQPSVTASADADAAEQYSKRRCTAMWSTVALHTLSVIILLIGLLAATRTGNVAVAGYYSGIILSFGTFLAIVGLNVVENRRPMLVASIIFISLGVISCFFCAIVDGIIAAEYIDRRPLMEGRCEFYASSTGYAFDNYYNEVVCQNYNQDCKIKVKTNTCYCCDLYNCESPGYHSHYFEFTGVSSCWDVVHLHRLLWSDVVLNVLEFSWESLLLPYWELLRTWFQLFSRRCLPGQLLHHTSSIIPLSIWSLTQGSAHPDKRCLLTPITQCPCSTSTVTQQPALLRTALRYL